MKAEPKNILLINFGQIGDVIISLPAMRAVRERFPDSKLTLAIGKSANAIVEMSGLADEIIPVDRVAMEKGNPIWSIWQVLKLIRNVRKRRFDFVLDLHSLPETNILGFLSGAKSRLYSKRGTRSLDYLSNFKPEPPDDDFDVHMTDFYALSVEPLGVKDARKPFKISPSKEIQDRVDKIFCENQIEGKKLVGINIGAGHPTRASNIIRFGELAKKIEESGDARIVVFAGPEEAKLRSTFREHFDEKVVLLDRLSLKELTYAFSKLIAVVGNDTGPIHLATAVGTPVVLVIGKSNYTRFIPKAKDLRVVAEENVFDFETEHVISALESLTGN